MALAAAEQAQQLGLEPDSEELRDALAFVDAQLFDVVMACLSSSQKIVPSRRRSRRRSRRFVTTMRKMSVVRSVASRSRRAPWMRPAAWFVAR